MDEISQQLRDVINGQLERGETIARLERPVPGVRTWLIALAMVACGIFGTVHVVPKLSTATRGEWTIAGKPVSVGMSVAVVAGHALGVLGFITAPLVYLWQSHNTAYVITNRRVLVTRRRLLRGVKQDSIPATLLNLTVKSRRNGIGGDIMLVAEGSVEKGLENSLIDLRDVRATEIALRNLIQSSSKSSL